MAWASMHFATGMACSGVLGLTACFLMRKRYQWVPLVMTIGGVWGMGPDLPRIFREDFKWLPFAKVLGDRQNEIFLHEWGNIFFFHRALDQQPHEYALHGLLGVILLYNLALAALLLMRRCK